MGDVDAIEGTTAAELRLAAVARFHSIAATDVAGCYGLGRSSAGELAIIGRAGIGEVMHTAVDELARRTEALESMARSLMSPPRAETTSFVERDRLTTRHVISEGRPDFFEKFGLSAQLRLLVYRGAQFVAWIGGLRLLGAPAFTRRDSARLARHVGPISEALVAAHALAHDAVGGRALAVLRVDGTIEHASPAARAWLDGADVRAAVVDWVIALDRNHAASTAKIVSERELHVTMLDGPQGPRYLVQISQLTPIRRSFVLSPRQLEVARLAADGAIVDEIARRLRCERETVRTHLRAVYQRLSVSSRVELVRALAAL